MVSLQVRRQVGGSFDASRRTRLRRRAQQLLALLGDPSAQLSILLTDDTEIHELNRQWRGKDRPTDVLSFSQLEGEGLAPLEGPRALGALLGDVVISLETTRRQALRRGRGPAAFDAELIFLLVHGALHLLGHDHLERAESRRMRAEEERLWQGLGGSGPARGTARR